VDSPSPPSLALVRRACAGDPDALDPEVVVRDSDGAATQVIRGRDGVMAWLAICAADLDEMVGVDRDRVVAFSTRVASDPAGMATERRDGLRWTVRGGRVALVERYPA